MSAFKTIAIGQCFPWALKFAEDGDVIKHGEVRDPWDGHYFAHAWVQRGGKVYDWQTVVARQVAPITQREWYELWKPRNMVKYTQEQALILSLRTGNSGPWTAREQAALKKR